MLGWCGSLVGSGSIEKELAVVGLNILIGSIGQRGGVLPIQSDSRGKQSDPVCVLDQIPDQSLRLLILDPAESGLAIPWESIERKLHPQKGYVVSLSPYLTGWALRARYIIPSPVHLESVCDRVSLMPDGATAIQISAALLAIPPKATEPISFLEKLTESLRLPSLTSGLNHKAILCKRLAEIQRTRSGTVLSFRDGSAIDLKDAGSPEELFDRLMNGATLLLVDNACPSLDRRFSLLGYSADTCKKMLEAALDVQLPDETSQYPLLAVPSTEDAWIENLPLPPALTKVYQESDLRLVAHRARIHPDTARQFQLSDGEAKGIATANRTQASSVTIDSSVIPGIIVLSQGPETVEYCTSHDYASAHQFTFVGKETTGVLPATLTSVKR